MIKKGFTLIELLIVMSIIGVLIAISIFGLSGARESARDSRRKSDLELIRSGLELYKADCNSYPATLDVTSGNATLVGTGSGSCLAGNTYITKIPADTQSGRNYVYQQVTANSYNLCASLEQGGTAVDCGTSCGSSCNYKVTNP